MLYIKWVNLLDKSGIEVFAASEREKLLTLGDTRQDMIWAEPVPEKYLAAMQLLLWWNFLNF